MPIGSLSGSGPQPTYVQPGVDLLTASRVWFRCVDNWFNSVQHWLPSALCLRLFVVGEKHVIADDNASCEDAATECCTFVLPEVVLFVKASIPTRVELLAVEPFDNHDPVLGCDGPRERGASDNFNNEVRGGINQRIFHFSTKTRREKKTRTIGYLYAYLKTSQRASAVSTHQAWGKKQV